MKECANCGFENDEDEACCTECGKTQFAAVDVTAESEMPPAASSQYEYEFAALSAEERQKDLVTLASCRTLSAADYLVCRLRGAGIEAFIPDENLMQWVGWNFNTFGYVRVQIAPKDYEAAKDLLAD